MLDRALAIVGNQESPGQKQGFPKLATVQTSVRSEIQGGNGDSQQGKGVDLVPAGEGKGGFGN